MREIVLSNAPLLKAISGDLAALRLHAVAILLMWVALSAAALGIVREFSISNVKIDFAKLSPSLYLLTFLFTVVWLCFACYLTAEAISGYKDRLALLDLSGAVGATNNVHVIIELLDGGFGLDAECAADPARGAIFNGSNLCWSASGAQTLGLTLLFAAGCLAGILTFRDIYLKDGRQSVLIIIAAIFCIGFSIVAVAYTGLGMFSSAEATILHELRRAATTLR